jgi:hypothetical protein
MTTNLTPEDLATLQAMLHGSAGGSGWSPDSQWTGGMVGNNYWTPTYTGGWNGGEAGYGDTAALTGYMRDVNAGHHAVGDMQDMYDTQGNYLGTKAIPKTDPIGEYLVPALMAGWGMAAAGGLMGAGAGAADAGVGAAVDPMMYGGTGAGTWGAGTAATEAGSGLTMGSDLFPAIDTSAISGPIPGLAELAPIGAGTGYTLGSELFPPIDTSGLKAPDLSGLKPLGDASSLPDWAKLLAGGLGAAAGAQGTQDTSTQQKDIPAWLKPAVLGAEGHPGILGYTQQTLDRMMQPGFLSGYDTMRSVGQQLMGTPQRGNGFDLFYGAGVPHANAGYPQGMQPTMQPNGPQPMDVGMPISPYIGGPTYADPGGSGMRYGGTGPNVGGFLGGSAPQLAAMMPWHPTGSMDPMFAGVNPNERLSPMY